MKAEDKFEEEAYYNMWLNDLTNFEKGNIIEMMEDYHQLRLKEIMPTESEINEQAELHFDKHTIACRTWIGGAKGLKSEIEKRNKLKTK